MGSCRRRFVQLYCRFLPLVVFTFESPMCTVFGITVSYCPLIPRHHIPQRAQQAFPDLGCVKPEAVTCKKKKSEFRLQESTKCNTMQTRYDTYLVALTLLRSSSLTYRPEKTVYIIIGKKSATTPFLTPRWALIISMATLDRISN